MVGQLVGMQVGFLVEPLVASLEGTYERLFPGVYSHMCLEIEVQGKPFVTEFAFVRFLTLVLK